MGPEAPEPAWPEAFTPAVWAALFPAYPTPPPPTDMPADLARVAKPAVADEARAARPMTLAALLEGLKDAPLMRGLLRLQVAVVKRTSGNAFYALARALYVALRVGAMPALAWVGNRPYGLFGDKQLVAMTVAFVVQDVIWEVGMLRGRAFAKEKEAPVRTPQAADERSPLDNHPLAGLARYRFLEQDTSDPESPAGELAHYLLQHRPDDPFCSCPRRTCTGYQLKAAPALSFVEFTGSLVVLLVVYTILSFWTVFVTFGGFTFSSPWAGTIAAFATAYISAYLLYLAIGANLNQSNVAVFGLEMRLRRRAVEYCLSQLTNRIEGHLADAEQEWKPQAAESEPYIVLHAALASSWSTRLAIGDSVRFSLAVGFVGDLTALSIVMLSTSCIAAPFVSSLFWSLAVLFLLDLVNLAAANAETSRISALYSSAAYTLRSLALRAGGPSQLTNAIQWHEAILRGFADADAYRARFFGVPVTPAVVRTAAVTAFTVGVGMWSVLRGAGIGVTIEMACPSGNS
ncbi:hypothetical protein DFJ74DRAFT_682939 [Hyaloraphidium curvatum]|nr:hypothetical protein DFJ74DRAFT_682939 [Hyaloraphidium curvatum]